MTQAFDAALMRRLRALLLIAEAALEADVSGVDAWQYAMPTDALLSHSGMTQSDLQWLINARLVECLTETTKRTGEKRSFRPCRSYHGAGTCFVLSAPGLRLSRQMHMLIATSASPTDLKPEWNAATGAWTLAGLFVKRLPTSATAQRRVLDRCQEKEWAAIVDSPFADMPASRRSHYLGQVLHHLNKGQIDAHIHCSSLDKGRKVRWAVIA